MTSGLYSKKSILAIYVVTDYVMANIAWLCFNIFRVWLLPAHAYNTVVGLYSHYPNIWAGQLLFPILSVFVFYLSGFYNSCYHRSRLELLSSSLVASLFDSLLIFFVAILNDGAGKRDLDLSMLFALWGLMFSFVFCGRWTVSRWVTRSHVRGKWCNRSIAVGKKAEIEKLINSLKEFPNRWGVTVVATVGERVGDLPVIGREDLRQYISDSGISYIIACPEIMGRDETTTHIDNLLPLGLPILVTPTVSDSINARPRISYIAGEPLYEITSPPAPAWVVSVKRFTDIVVSTIALIILIPLFIILAIIIKRGDGGPVFYTQERLGKGKKRFRIVKFRTMVPAAETTGVPMLSSAGDSRITKAGHFLRKYRLDELPQFWNVLKGDMSVVGPRPERPYFADKLQDLRPEYSLLFRVRPGITSWGMVKYGYASDLQQMTERMAYDLLYIQNLSITVDIKIFFYTIRTVITGKGV